MAAQFTAQDVTMIAATLTYRAASDPITDRQIGAIMRRTGRPAQSVLSYFARHNLAATKATGDAMIKLLDGSVKITVAAPVKVAPVKRPARKMSGSVPVQPILVNGRPNAAFYAQAAK